MLDGLDMALAKVAPAVDDVAKLDILACSSAGGGLRLAVVGYERSITAEAGYRVALSAGARVVHVFAGNLTSAAVTAIEAASPDVLLLVGGTDGGNAEVLVHNARWLSDNWSGGPVVVAGNTDVRDEVTRILREANIASYMCANVLPKIGQLEPVAVRETIRQVFIEHVIGGKHLSRRVDLGQLVRAATPDAVLTGVELLADGTEQIRGVGDVLVVDVGGATTDVYSVVTPDAEAEGLDREPVSTLWRSRTVEGDLGVRWNAVGIVEAAVTERLIESNEFNELAAAAEMRTAQPEHVPTDDVGMAIDVRLVTLAATVALRRHARSQLSGEVRFTGKDLRRVALVVGSGGVLRHADRGAALSAITESIADVAGGWRRPDNPLVVIDASYVLAAAGLISRQNADAAMRLLAAELM